MTTPAMPNFHHCVMGLLLLSSAVCAQLTPSPYFGDHMVLQRLQPVPVWGRAAPGTQVTVAFRQHRLSTTTDADGRWRVDLPALQPGEPATLHLTAGKASVIFNDVLVGDVWLCGGQSNMAMALARTAGGRAEADAAQVPELRLLHIENQYTPVPTDTVPGTWKRCDPTSAADFSAVAYYFGRELHRELGVPIGLISASRGGTTAEAWMPREALLPYPDLLAKADAEAARIADVEGYEALRRDIEDFDRRMDELQAALPAPAAEAFDPRAPLEGEQDIAPGVAFLEDTEGVAHVRRVFSLDEAKAAAPGAVLHLGHVNDFDVTWINGMNIGFASRSDRMDPRRYPVPAGLLRAGENVLLVQLIDRNRTASFGGGIEAPFLAWPNGDTVPLHAPWHWKLAHDAGVRPVSLVDRARQTGTLFFNGMIAPIAPAALRGVIWYQGEANVTRTSQYRSLFPDLIRSWRGVFERDDLPFYFVQLPNYRARGNEPGESEWAELREAQRQATALPHTGIAVTIDIGEAGDIHPKNKRDVGLRLARLVLGEVHGIELPQLHASPLFRGVLVEGDHLRIHFDHAEGGLTTTDGEAPTAFALAGEDRVFRWVEARIDGSEVVIPLSEGGTVRHVRYAWADNPAVNLVNTAGLPATPFEAPVTP